MSASHRTVRPTPRGPRRASLDPRAETSAQPPGTSANAATAEPLGVGEDTATTTQPPGMGADTATAHGSADVPSRTRRDPRAERRGAAGVRGRMRLDRAQPLQPVSAPPAQGVVEARMNAGPTRVPISDPACWVLAVPDQQAGRLSVHDRDMFGAARRLADACGGAVVALVGTDDGGLGAAGADRVMCLDDGAEDYVPEARTAALLSIVRTLNPRHVVLPDVPHAGGDLGRRVAAALGEMPATNVVRLDDEHLTSRGDGGRSDFTRAAARIVLVAPEAADPLTGAVHEAAALPAPAWEGGTARIADLGLRAVDPGSVPLAEAGLVLSGGAGVEDWAAFHALAAALGAAEGGSRVVCDAGALPRDRQVGASGALVSARGYIALGISGAPQHLEGIKNCECVIAVNTDAHAEIVRRADLAVIGDAQEIMAALLSHLVSEPHDDP